jgi:HEAT repeat protein
VPALISILADQQEEPQIREHAAYAIGHIRDKRAIPILGKILNSNEGPNIKAECIFALSKMWEFRGDAKSLHPRALAILNQFARTRPTGNVAEQLKEALSNIRCGITRLGTGS